ncbi:YceI family protein [Schaalia naturae]|jgi:polyisoprenoid-binding protein YceI|uniref:YceI family protein n=1 Tax=Schaalia naturae TaxID=635203 RepID=A0ABW2SRA8_9ACTO
MSDLQGKWTIDHAHSTIGFVVRHAVSKVKGEFTDFTSEVVSTGPDTADVTATVQAVSFSSRNEMRDNHIKSADFLDAENFPTLDFTGKVADGKLSGDLTIHGVTRPIAFDLDSIEVAKDPFGGPDFAGTEATAEISRKDFGLTWNQALETGGVLVGDKIKIDLDVSFLRVTE